MSGVTGSLVLLATKDGIADGPLHLPAPVRDANSRRQELAQRIEENNGNPPVRWVALCGETGILYASSDLFRSLPECFGCQVARERRPVASWRRYESDEERLEARRRTWRESKQRARRKAA